MSSEQQSDTRGHVNRLSALFLLIGLAALVWMITSIGPAAMWNGLLQVGWVGFALVILLHLGAMCLDALVLRYCAGEQDRGQDGPAQLAPYWPCLKAALVGHAINNATPFASIGEVTKFTLLADRFTSARLVAGILAQNVIVLCTNLVVFGLVPLVAVHLVGLEGPLAVLLQVGGGVCLVFGVGILLVMRRGIGDWPFRLALRLHFPRARVERARAWWQRVERYTKQHARSSPRMRRIWAIALGGRLVDVAQTWVILYALGTSNVAVALLATSTVHVVAWGTPFVPMQAGTAEGSMYLLFRAIGSAAHTGVIVELLKKALRVVFVGIGVALLGVQAFREQLRSRASLPLE